MTHPMSGCGNTLATEVYGVFVQCGDTGVMPCYRCLELDRLYAIEEAARKAMTALNLYVPAGDVVDGPNADAVEVLGAALAAKGTT